MIDRQTIAKIMDAANIVDVVSEFVTLKKSGANYKGLCPFHNERTPSFSVTPARNYCHCFSCGKGGNPVGFIMEHEQMTYPEALRWLAKKYKIEIKERELTSEEKQAESEREAIFIVNEWVARHYADILNNDATGKAIGLQYFRSRGFRDDIIEKFRLGFALTDRYEMPRTAMKKGYKAEFLLKSGVCYQKDNVPQAANNGQPVLVDRFAGRAIFPWISMSGKVIAFGGRKLDKETKGVQQKYVNSPESIIYHKDHELYGIFQAKKAIAKEDRVFMVEGYTDVLSMHQCGIENVVANSGTALSFHQIRMLHRFTSNIVLLYDGDAAGIKAAMKGTNMLLQEGMNIKVLILPDGDDPDSFSRKHSAEDFKAYVESHQTDFIQFKTNQLLSGATDPTQRAQAISSIVESISFIPDNIVRAAYLQDCATRLRMAERELLQKMNHFIAERKKQEDRAAKASEVQAPEPDDMPPPVGVDDDMTQLVGQSQRQTSPQPVSVTSIPMVETMLLEAIVRYGSDTIIIETEDGRVPITVAQCIAVSLQSDDLSFSTDLYNRILNEAVEHSGEEGFNAAPYFSQHPDIEISQACMPLLIDRYTLSKSLEYNMTEETLRQHVEHLLLDFRKDYVDKKLLTLKHQLTAVSDDPEKMRELMTEYMQMQQISNALAKKLGHSLR